MRYRGVFILAGLLALGSTGSVPAAIEREVILHVEAKAAPWHDSDFEARLERTLTRHNGVKLTLTSRLGETTPAFPEAKYDLDSLVNWGMEAGGRYLVVVVIDAERLERRKRFHVPLIFHKYQTIGVIEGELRIVDIERGRLLKAEPFRLEKDGPKVFQGTMDDDVNDPDLHLSAPAKIRFFRDLEETLSRRLAARIKATVRIR